MAQTIIPNEFQLDGPGIHAGYSTSDLAGKTRLTLRQGRKTLSVAGDDIQALHPSIGALIM